MSAENLKLTSEEISRRQFFRRAAGVTAGIVVGSVAVREIDRSKNGIETNSGTFIPLYENHIMSISTEQIPSNMDMLFSERLWSYPKSELSADALLNPNQTG